MRPLRFALISTFYPPYSFGGDAVLVERLARALAARGHEVDVFHNADAYRYLSSNGEPAPPAPHPAITVHRLEHAAGSLACLVMHQTGQPVVHGRYIDKVMAERRFDVIHYHNVSLMGGPGILSRGDAIKLYTTHEYWLVCPTHVLWRHNTEPCVKPQCARCLVHHRRPPQPWRATNLLERSVASVDAFCAPSRFTAAKHKEFGFARGFEILPNFLPDTPLPEHVAMPADMPKNGYFLFAGRLEDIKGLDDIIPRFGPGAPAPLLIAGEGGYGETLRALADGSPNVRFLGKLDGNTLRHLYRGAIALIAPSRCFEVFPLVVLEAFRESTPVIARNLGPYPELLKYGGGSLFDDAEELASIAARFAADGVERDRLGRRGREIYEERWTEDVVMNQYFALIGKLARRRGDTQVLDALKAA